jgi:hypothetical protein
MNNAIYNTKFFSSDIYFKYMTPSQTVGLKKVNSLKFSDFYLRTYKLLTFKPYWTPIRINKTERHCIKEDVSMIPSDFHFLFDRLQLSEKP